MLRFGELVDTARGLGFDLYDAQNLLVDEELEMALEDENLVAEPVHVHFRPARGGQEEGIVADLTVGAQVFHLRGEWSLARELEQVVRGARATPGASSLGEPHEEPSDGSEPL